MLMLLLHQASCYFKLDPPCISSGSFLTNLQLYSTQLNTRRRWRQLQPQPKNSS
jgi:hypothetical protein